MKLFHQLCSLSQFGLNPNDWRLVPLKGSYYLIMHRQDFGYRFLGLYQGQKWRHLELISI